MAKIRKSKRKLKCPEKLTYSHTMNAEKVKKWKEGNDPKNNTFKAKKAKKAYDASRYETKKDEHGLANEESVAKQNLLKAKAVLKLVLKKKRNNNKGL